MTPADEGRQPIPRRVALGLRSGGPMVGGIARLLRHLLSLPGDDPELARLAAAAVLIVREGRTPSSEVDGWSTQEMDFLRSEVRRLETAWRMYLAAAGGSDAEGALTAAALHLLFREMEASVRDGKPIPGRDELLLRVAGELLGKPFSNTGEVEAAVAAMLSPAPRQGGLAGASRLAEEALACLAIQVGQAPRAGGAGCWTGGSLARAGALVGAMLGEPPDTSMEASRPVAAAVTC